MSLIGMYDSVIKVAIVQVCNNKQLPNVKKFRNIFLRIILDMETILMVFKIDINLMLL